MKADRIYDKILADKLRSDLKALLPDKQALGKRLCELGLEYAHCGFSIGGKHYESLDSFLESKPS